MAKQDPRIEREYSITAIDRIIGVAVAVFVIFVLVMPWSCTPDETNRETLYETFPHPSFTSEDAANIYPPMGQDQ